MVIGAISAFIPVALSGLGVIAAGVALPTFGAVAAAAGILAGVAGLMGFAAVATVGSDSGAVSAGFTEKERREKVAALEAQGLSAKDAELRITASEDHKPKPFRWQTLLVTLPTFAAFGAILGMNPVTAPILVGHMGFAAGTSAGIGASAGVMSMFGAIIGIPNAYITNKMTDFYYKVITGKSPEKKIETPVMAHVQEKPVEAALAPEIEQAQGKSFSAEKTRFSLQGIIEKTDEHSVAQPHIR